MTDYNVAVIGSGTVAQNVVPRRAEAGLRVAVVDRLPYGGTCARRGCDPKKVLLAAAETVGRARTLSRGQSIANRPSRFLDYRPSTTVPHRPSSSSATEDQLPVAAIDEAHGADVTENPAACLSQSARGIRRTGQNDQIRSR